MIDNPTDTTAIPANMTACSRAGKQKRSGGDIVGREFLPLGCTNLTSPTRYTSPRLSTISACAITVRRALSDAFRLRAGVFMWG